MSPAVERSARSGLRIRLTKKFTVQRTKIITIAGTLTKIIVGCGAIPLTLIQGGSDVTSHPHVMIAKLKMIQNCSNSKRKALYIKRPKVERSARSGLRIRLTKKFTAPKKRKIIIARILTQTMMVDFGATRPIQRKDGNNVFNLHHVMELLVPTKNARPLRRGACRSRIIINLI